MRVKVTMLKGAHGADESDRGITQPVQFYKAGETHELCPNLAKAFVEMGVAKHADSSPKHAAPKHEAAPEASKDEAPAAPKKHTKKMPGAPENKSE